MVHWRGVSHTAVSIAVFSRLALSQRVKAAFFIRAGDKTPAMVFVSTLSKSSRGRKRCEYQRGSGYEAHNLISLRIPRPKGAAAGNNPLR